MAKDANEYGNTSASGYGAYGHGNPWSHQYVEPPTFGGMSPENAESVFGGDSFAEAPRQILEDSDSVILPFQPRVYQDGSDWYFEFTTSGVVFLPVATGHTDTVWHIHWNEAWPFRPVMTDSSGGSVRAINDIHAYDPPSTSSIRSSRNTIFIRVYVYL